MVYVNGLWLLGWLVISYNLSWSMNNELVGLTISIMLVRGGHDSYATALGSIRMREVTAPFGELQTHGNCMAAVLLVAVLLVAWQRHFRRDVGLTKHTLSHYTCASETLSLLVRPEQEKAR